jgi:GNAT superfamily N-acetyltransferase
MSTSSSRGLASLHSSRGHRPHHVVPAPLRIGNDAMTADIDLWPLDAPAFARAVPALLNVYAAAMNPPSDQLAGRRGVMESHSALPGFASVVASTRASADTTVPVGFAYGFPGRAGQWWHDVVMAALRRHDAAAAQRWFATPFEIAEVHVHPDWQGGGVGRRMLRRGGAGAPAGAAPRPPPAAGGRAAAAGRRRRPRARRPGSRAP